MTAFTKVRLKKLPPYVVAELDTFMPAASLQAIEKLEREYDASVDRDGYPSHVGQIAFEMASIYALNLCERIAGEALVRDRETTARLKALEETVARLQRMQK